MDVFDLRLWPGFEKAGGCTEEPAWTDQIVIDSRRIDSSLSLFVALPGSTHDGHKFVKQAFQLGARYALVREDWPAPPDIEKKLLRTNDPLKAFQEIAKTYRNHKKAKVVAIVGSHGKTMVKDLLHAMVSQEINITSSPESFNSQIGVPLSLLTIKNSHQIALIEAGISQKHEMDVLADIVNPQAAIMTRIGKKHLATLGCRHTIAQEMSKIFTKSGSLEWGILPNDSLVKHCAESIAIPAYYWSTASDGLPHATLTESNPNSKSSYQVIFPDDFAFRGHITTGYYYFIDLINITIKAAWLLGISSSAIIRTLEKYKLEAMRTEIWQSQQECTFINDTYCSDPQSVDQALKLFDLTSLGRKIFVFGGMRSETEHAEMDYRRIGKAIHRTKLDTVALIGNHPFESLIKEVKEYAPETSIYQFDQYSEAVGFLKGHLKQKDSVIIKGESKEPLDKWIEAFQDSISTNQCFINLAAIKSNLEILKARLPKNTRIMTMVKAFAYGTDELRIAKFMQLCGVDILGVSYVDEGIALKQSGVSQTIFTINAALYEVQKVVKWELEVGVSSENLIEALDIEAGRQEKIIKVHLHVDTGMGRFGCRIEEAVQLARKIINHKHLRLEGIMTHFPCAELPEEDGFTREQASKFDNVIKSIEREGIEIPWKHAANSAGAIRFDFPQYNMVRIGLAVYGLYSSESMKEALDLRLALSLTSRVVGLNLCKAGETISYGRSYTIKKERQLIAVIPIGYFDGLHRNYSGKGHVMIRGHKAPMVGKICMDFMMVDVTDIPHVSIGDSVLIFGEDEYGQFLPPEELAMQGNSIVYELVTCLGPRIQRVFILEEAHKIR